LISYGDRVIVTLPAGVYIIRVGLHWARSRELEVRVREGELVELECHLRWRGIAWVIGLFAVLITPRSIFLLRAARVPPEGVMDVVAEAARVSVGIGVLAFALWMVSFTGWLS
jgi:hypothetical protein